LAKKPAGFILLTTLIFLHLYFLLVITMLNQAHNTAMLNSAINIREQAVNISQQLMIKLNREWHFTLPLCILPLDQAMQLRSQAWADVLGSACTGEFTAYRYYYFVSIMGTSVCGVHYWVILMLQPPQQEINLLLQAIFVDATSAQNKCSIARDKLAIQFIN
jgi:hypothetical protein